MKFYLMNLFVLSIFLTYKAQGIRLGKVDISTINHQDIFKISIVKESIQDDQMLVKSAQVSSGINRKLMTKTTSSVTISEKNKHDLKPEVQHWKKDVISEQHPDVMNIDDEDYTPARKKSPIHN
ncbi:uncharacterized protein LOC143632292 [Bidens hawaiensis]|uniref:uncharacterized protein LOC143632292 n=1 Tax=Bidens hawaiensis TaxID=980011 RepID=UPI0040499107